MAIDKNHPKYKQLILVSNPTKVIKNANSYLGKNNYEIFVSDRNDKKYMIINNANGKKVHFGNINYQDFSKSNDETHRNSYLARAMKIKGNWQSNKYSPNNLAIHLLW